MSNSELSFLEKSLPRLRTGKALAIPTGSGDTAIYLAKQGFEVTSFDQNKENVEKLQNRTAADKLKIKAEAKQLDIIIIPIMSFDTIVLTGPKPSSRLFSEITRGLSQGGTVLIEGPSLEEATKEIGISTHPSNCYKPNELISLLKELHILYYSEEKVNENFLIRCLAKKPMDKDMVKYGFAQLRPGDEKKSAAVLAAEKLFKK